MTNNDYIKSSKLSKLEYFSKKNCLRAFLKDSDSFVWLLLVYYSKI